MNQIEKDAALIAALGGAAKVAEILGYPTENGVQRVFNWTVRGIPPGVKLENPALFLKDFEPFQRQAGNAPELATPTGA